MRRVACLVLMLGAFAGLARAQEEPKAPKPPVVRPHGAPREGPRSVPKIVGQVYLGEEAPDFELPGSLGDPVKLSLQRGMWTLLVFSDGRAPLIRLRDIAPNLRKLDVRILGVCSEKTHALKSAAVRDSVPFLMLSDVTGEISMLYGLYDYEHSEIRPGFVLLDRKGIVKMALLGQSLPEEQVAELVRFAVGGL